MRVIFLAILMFIIASCANHLPDAPMAIKSAVANDPRPIENIQQTMEQHRPEIFKIYQDYLENQPNIKGSIVFRMEVTADGSVQNLTVISEDLGVESLVNKVLSQIQKINFGEMNAKPTKVEWKFFFLPE